MAGQAYTDWAAQVKAAGGVVTAWPFADPFQGGAAARYDSARYAELYNSGAIDPEAPQQTNPAGSYVYVLAGESVQRAAPATMTDAQRVANYLFTMGDTAADAVGLPSLDSLEQGAKRIVTAAAIGAAIVGGILLYKALK